MALTSEVQAKLDEFKAAWGITGDIVDKKLERLIAATGGVVPLDQLQAMIRTLLQPSNIEFALTRALGEITSAFATGRSVRRTGRPRGSSHA